MLSLSASRLFRRTAATPTLRRHLHTSQKPRALKVFPATTLASSDTELAMNANYKAARAKFSVAASKERIEKTKKALESHGHIVTVVPNKAAALETLQSIIPHRATINSAESTTLLEIGFADYVSTSDKWDNLKLKMQAEKDPEKKELLRRQALTADYGLSSVDAVTENGEFMVVDKMGTRVVIAHAAAKAIYVVGSQKIVKDMDTAWERVHQYSFETEGARIRTLFEGAKGTTLSNIFINKTAPYNKGHFHFLIVEEPVGY